MTVSESVHVPYVDLPAQHAPLREELRQAVDRVLEHGRFILGPEVAELESIWAQSCNVRNTISVSDGTMALLLVLHALGIKRGDHVITVPNSFVASASSIALVGAVPRFVDVGDDFNIDAASVRSRLTSKTRAILAVHLAGRPADIDALHEIASEHELILLEDAAQAFGARYRGRPVGGLARAGCFSLHPLKTAGACGDAGIITTDDDELAKRLRRLRNHGFETRQEDCAVWGFNARMDTIQAAMAMVKLKHVAEWTQRRRAIAAEYRKRLSCLVRIPADRPDDLVVYHTFPVEADRRDALMEFLRQRGVECKVHYRIPIHRLAPARAVHADEDHLAVAERQAGRIISLPIHQCLTDDQVGHVCDAIEDFYRR